MIHNTEFFEMIENYFLDQLSEKLKSEFEAELAQNPELRKEFELHKEINEAIFEKDVLTLRGRLEKVAQNDHQNKVSESSFELFDELSDIQEINEVFTSEELINFFDSLPKVHAYHHEVTSNENIHHFYKDQQKKSYLEGQEEDWNDLDLEMEFEGIGEAILEKDVLNLRQTLKQVARSVEPQFTVEEIDDFINGELSGDELVAFEKDFLQNSSLQEEVQLHKSLESAVTEYDVMELRNQMSNIMQAETSWNVSERNIEDFIDGVLEGDELSEFRAELQDNSDLRAEVKLRQQINELLGETDISDLRNELTLAKEKAEVKKVKMLIPETKVEYVRFWRNSVAIIIVLIGLVGLLGNSFESSDRIYSSFYESPEWAPERTATEEIDYLQKANLSYVKGEYNDVVSMGNILPENLANSPVFQFYEGASLQNLGRYSEAIPKYTMIIKNGDNLYIEEAEWYRSLCYVKLGNKVEAKQQLLAVIERKGHYENEAKAIIRRLKYSMK
ncbi:MAG: hypothetical protein R2757_14755 [Draconibacterium sp.]